MRTVYVIMGFLTALSVAAAAARAQEATKPPTEPRAQEATKPPAQTLAEPPAQAPAPAGPAPLVVIDPGHGGSNTGAPGAVPGLFEKQVTLELARTLWERLRARGYRVVLTRDRDTYLTLRQRVGYANRVGADLFVSLHTNASASHTNRGYETYLLPPEALDVNGRALRLEDGVPRANVDRDTAMLLDDVERGSAQAMAADLAVAVQRELGAVRGQDGDRGVRQGAMDVLLGATMPAVLIEIGFLDHPVEGRELAEPAVREQIAGALSAAIMSVLPAPAR